jgi:hypothetical protein
MTTATITGSLGTDLVSGSGNLVVNYPPGTSRGDFLMGVNNAVAIGQVVYKAPGKCAFTLGATTVSIANKSGVTWLQGTPYAVQLDMPSADAGSFSQDGVKMPRVVPWPMRFLDLGSPLALSASGLRAAAAVAAAGPIALLATVLDVPRNITIQSAGNDSARTFTISSRDVYGKAVVETMAGAAIGTATGKKAHFSNLVISIDGAAAGNVNIGWGNVLGLPCYVPSSIFVQKELQDGAVATAGTLVVGDQTQPTGITGDVRGTYVPNAAPDGTKAYGLLVCMPDPGYLGADQFAG